MRIDHSGRPQRRALRLQLAVLRASQLVLGGGATWQRPGGGSGGVAYAGLAKAPPIALAGPRALASIRGMWCLQPKRSRLTRTDSRATQSSSRRWWKRARGTHGPCSSGSTGGGARDSGTVGRVTLRTGCDERA